MDYIVWSRIIGPLAIMIFVIYVIISSNRAAKELVQKKSEANNQVNASVKNESALPPFVEDYQRFPLETGSAQEAVKNGEADMLIGAKQSEPKLGEKANRTATGSSGFSHAATNETGTCNLSD